MVSPHTLAVALWANNHGGDAGDPVANVHAARNQDRDLDARKQSSLASHLPSSASDQESDDEVAADLMAAVALIG